MVDEKHIMISVIIPVYNSEKYLYECIDSVLTQSYQDFELILVNDGSTDGSRAICDEYVAKDKRVKVFHKKNGGVSSARNIGIEKASGKYICFIDSDDWIEKDFLFDISQNANNFDLTISTNIYYDYPEYKYQRTAPYNKTSYNNSDIICFLDQNNFFTTAEGGSCSKLFEKSIIDQDSQKFLLDNAAYEDTLFTFKYLSKCDNVQIVKGACYHYIHRNSNSLSSKIHPYNNYLESGQVGLEIFEDLTRKYNVDLYSEVFRKGITYFLNILNYSIFSIYSNPAAYSSNERIKILRFVSLINKKHQIAYCPKNVKKKIVKNILRINLKLADKALLIVFALSMKIKRLTGN